MKTLILYATKRGVTREIAHLLASRMPDATVIDLKQKSIPTLDGYDCVLIGSSLYIGMIRKEAKNYLTLNAGALCGKRLGLFLSGMDASKADQYFESNFPQELLRNAKAKSFLGGIFDPAKSNFLERFLVKKVSGISAYIKDIDDDKVDRFVEALTA